MPNQITDILDNLNKVYRKEHKNIIESLGEYIYREQRYKVHFSTALVFSKEPLHSHFHEIKKVLRKSDTIKSITDTVLLVAFDAMEEANYIKSAENLHKTLKSIEFHQDYFISTTFSGEFEENYLNMVNHLFERLHYAIKHNLSNDICAEDYFIS